MKRIGIIIFLAFLFSCKEKKKTDYSKLLVPVNSRLRPHDLLKDGFTRVWGVDVLMYEKEEKDTIYSYQFNDLTKEEDYGIIGYQAWTIKNLSIENASAYKAILKELRLQPFGVVDSCDQIIVNDIMSNSFFRCVCKENELRIVHHHSIPSMRK